MRVLDLFSGIGGMSIGLERAGMTTVGFCEIEPFPRAVLKKHWPKIWCHNDVRTLDADLIQQKCGTVDLVCGGVPCQPASVAGKRRGAKDERWLWGEFMRIVRAVRPAWVVAENVPGFLSLGDESEAVFRELEQEGYSVWPLVLGADDVGAPHRRKRLWIVANSERGESGTGYDVDLQRRRSREAEQIRMGGCRRELANSTGRRFRIDGSAPRNAGHVDECGANMANGQSNQGDGAEFAISEGDPFAPERNESARGLCVGRWPARPGERQHEWERPRLLSNAKSRAPECGQPRQDGSGLEWQPQQPVGGATNGLSVRLVRLANRNALRAFGNSIIPQCSEAIGRAIMAVDS